METCTCATDLLFSFFLSFPLREMVEDGGGCVVPRKKTVVRVCRSEVFAKVYMYIYAYTHTRARTRYVRMYIAV